MLGFASSLKLPRRAPASAEPTLLLLPDGGVDILCHSPEQHLSVAHVLQKHGERDVAVGCHATTQARLPPSHELLPGCTYYLIRDAASGAGQRLQRGCASAALEPPSARMDNPDLAEFEAGFSGEHPDALEDFLWEQDPADVLATDDGNVEVRARHQSRVPRRVMSEQPQHRRHVEQWQPPPDFVPVAVPRQLSLSRHKSVDRQQLERFAGLSFPLQPPSSASHECSLPPPSSASAAASLTDPPFAGPHGPSGSPAACAELPSPVFAPKGSRRSLALQAAGGRPGAPSAGGPKHGPSGAGQAGRQAPTPRGSAQPPAEAATGAKEGLWEGEAVPWEGGDRVAPPAVFRRAATAGSWRSTSINAASAASASLSSIDGTLPAAVELPHKAASWKEGGRGAGGRRAPNGAPLGLTHRLRQIVEAAGGREQRKGRGGGPSSGARNAWFLSQPVPEAYALEYARGELGHQ